MPELSEASRDELINVAFDIKETEEAFLGGPAKDGEHVVYYDAGRHDQQQPQRVQVLSWYATSARVRFPGTSGSNARGVKRAPAFAKIVDRRDRL
jgi:hypothetical protein